jgi:hypothetical protein
MFLTVGAPEEIEASSKDPVAFTVAGKTSNLCYRPELTSVMVHMAEGCHQYKLGSE